HPRPVLAVGREGGHRPAVRRSAALEWRRERFGGPEATMEIKVLEAEIMRGNIHSTYLVVGADAPRRHQAVRLLEEALCPPDVREWCLVKVDGEEASGAEVRDLVSTPPFLGERRVVVVKDAEKLADAEALVPYVEDPPGFSVLILAAESVDRRQRLLRAIEKHGLVLA